jgi:hypothetical protein
MGASFSALPSATSLDRQLARLFSYFADACPAIRRGEMEKVASPFVLIALLRHEYPSPLLLFRSPFARTATSRLPIQARLSPASDYVVRLRLFSSA